MVKVRKKKLFWLVDKKTKTRLEGLIITEDIWPTGREGNSRRTDVVYLVY